MAFFSPIPAGKWADADYAVILEDDALAPYLRAGQTAYLQYPADLHDGDVGLFLARDGLVFRQYCRDIRGTVYLLSLDRTRKEEDREFPAYGELPICFGRVLLRRRPELPMD